MPIDPLVSEQFAAEGKVSVRTWFADRQIEVIYHNPERLEYGRYKVARVTLNNQELCVNSSGYDCRILRQQITDLEPSKMHQIYVWLAAK